MAVIDANTNEPIALGQQGDNNVTQVRFDVTELAHTYGDGTVVLQHQRTQDPVPYAIKYSKTTADNKTYIVWTVSLHDTEQPLKYGKCELRYYVGRSLKKSMVYQTYVTADPTGTGIPYPVPPGMLWVDSLAMLTKDAQDARDKAEMYRDSAQTAYDNANGAMEEAERQKELASGYANDSLEYANAAEESATNAGNSETRAGEYAEAAATSAHDAQLALQGMTYVTFGMNPATGHVTIKNGDLLGTTEFVLAGLEGTLPVTAYDTPLSIETGQYVSTESSEPLQTTIYIAELQEGHLYVKY